MSPIDEIIDDFNNGKLAIDCSGMSDDELHMINDALNGRVAGHLNDSDFIFEDGRDDFGGYINYYVSDFPYLVLRPGSHVFMTRNRSRYEKVVSYAELIDPDFYKEVDESVFNLIFE